MVKNEGRAVTRCSYCAYIKLSKKQETAESIHQLLLLKKGMFPIFNVTSSPTKNEYFT